MEIILILLLAIALDLTLGEPPTALHPVVWMGKTISLFMKTGISRSRLVQFLYGAVMAILIIGVFTAAAYFALSYLRILSPLIYVVIGSFILKTTFSLKGLWRAAFAIRRLIKEKKLAEARYELRALVSRDTRNLDEGQIVSATVESVAENVCDSFVAPLFYFLFFGVPGAIAYRVVNTLDAMIGYHGEFEYLGKFAARLDDVANIIPSRISALLIVAATWISRKNVRGAWRIMLRDGRKTESPNAGWTMSAIAGALGIQLEKVGHYRLGDNQRPPSIEAIGSSLTIVMTAAAIWCVVVILTRVGYLLVTG